MKYKKSILFLLLTTAILLPHFGSATMITIGGSIANDTTWTNDDSIRVVSSVAVGLDARLTIQPGTVILFNPGINIQVRGELYADGKENGEIVFTSIYDTTGGFPTPGNWPGIYFLEQSSGTMNYCRNRYATYGFRTQAATAEFYHCTAESFSVYGFYIDGILSGSDAPIIIDHCVARQEDASQIGHGTGINVYQKADISISQCQVYNCQIGIDLNAHSFAFPTFDIVHCDIHDNIIYGIMIESCG